MRSIQDSGLAGMHGATVVPANHRLRHWPSMTLVAVGGHALSPLTATTRYRFTVQHWHGSGPDHGQFTGVVYPLNQDPAQDYALYVR